MQSKDRTRISRSSAPERKIKKEAERGREGESSPFGFAVEAAATPREKEKSVACPARVIKDQREDTEYGRKAGEREKMKGRYG